MKKQFLIIIFALVALSSSCDNNDNPSVNPPSKDFFPSWNQCEALTLLQEYVEDVTDPRSANFISAEDRIATFDMDGTFVGELYPTYFEYNMLEYRALDDPSYKDQAPADVREAAQNIRDFVRKGTPLPNQFDLKHARAAAKAYAGMTIAQFDAYVKAYAAFQANGFTGMTYGESFYKPMLEVFDYLKANGFTYYVVSGSDRFICRSLVESIGIDKNKVIGMDVWYKSSKQGDNAGVNYNMGSDEDLIRTDSLLIKNLKTNGDEAMHNYCKGNQKYRTATFMLVADDDVRDHADLAEGARREAKWRQNGYTVISMKNDFKTIYGYGVQKTDFIFPEE